MREIIGQNKLISDLKEMYVFLATLGIEVINLVFVNDDLIWGQLKFTAEERVPRGA